MIVISANTGTGMNTVVMVLYGLWRGTLLSSVTSLRQQQCMCKFKINEKCRAYISNGIAQNTTKATF